MSYEGIIEAIKSKNPKKFLYTVEFFPEEGKYHFDGHRECGLSLSPMESKKYNNVCPICAKPLTIGVLSRVEELADRAERYMPDKAVPFKRLIPLEEVIADVLGRRSGTKQGKKEYDQLIKKFGNEFSILTEESRESLLSGANPKIAEAILRVREERVQIEPGYDGVYGKVNIFPKEQIKAKPPNQITLF